MIKRKLKQKKQINLLHKNMDKKKLMLISTEFYFKKKFALPCRKV